MSVLSLFLISGSMILILIAIYATILSAVLLVIVSIALIPYVIYQFYKRRNIIIFFKQIISIVAIYLYYFPIWAPLRQYSIFMFLMYLVLIIWEWEDKCLFEAVIVILCIIAQFLIFIPKY